MCVSLSMSYAFTAAVCGVMFRSCQVKAINKRVLEHGQLAAGRHTDRSVGGSVSEEPGSITPDSRKDSDAPHTVAAKRATYTATAFSGPLPLSSYKDAHGHDAAVLRGWLTRPSKGVVLVE
jgi:hypothetical protein